MHANGNMTNDGMNTLAYDGENHTVSSSGSLGSGTYTYDGNGLRVKKVAGSTATVYIFSGSKVIAEYDNGAPVGSPSREYIYAGGALLAKFESDGTTPTATFLYDAATVTSYGLSVPNPVGRLVEASVGCAFTTNSYDVMGRIAQQVQQTPLLCNYYYVLPYSYDLAGDMTSAGNGYFGTYTYGYNSAGRLTSLTGYLSAQKYTAFGAVASDTLGDTETESYTYDKRLRLKSASSSYSGTPTYSYSLTFTPNSDVIAANDSVNGNWNYSYDAFNRLTCSNLATNGTCTAPTNGTPTYSYTYDRFGNRWNQTGPQTFNATFTGNVPGGNANNNRLDGYSYDSAGNLLNDKNHQYYFDAENRLIQVDGTLGTCSSATACYSYDANGRRVSRSGYKDDTCDSTGLRGYVYDLSDRMILETIPNEMGCKYEIYAGGRHLGSYRGEAIFSHTDWVGTERVRISAPYAQYRNYDQHCTSLPFGDGMSPCDGSYSSTLHFTGKERDLETSLDNFGARYNASSMGRFLTPDWSAAPMGVPYAAFDNPQSLNLYAYVGNNPTSRVDPNGHSHQQCDPDTFYIDPQTGAANLVAGQCRTVPDWYDFAFLTAAFGHHGVAQAISRTLDLSSDAARFLNRQFVTGRLTGSHFFTTAHRAYNRAVQQLVRRYMLDRAALSREGELAGDEAKEIGSRLLNSKDPEIEEFIDNLPETASGKTGRQVLEEALVEGNTAEMPEAAEVLLVAGVEATAKAAAEGEIPVE